MKNETSHNVSRRDALKKVGGLVAAAPFLALVACGGTTNTASSDVAENDQPSDSGSTGSTTGSAGDATNASGWATGGTASMTVDFPETALFTTGAVCSVALTGAQTEGPCYFQVDGNDDISTGREGLPTQLCLRLIDSECNPLSDHEVEVWHCDNAGLYSGDTSSSSDASRFAGDFCTGGDQTAEASRWFRGTLITDADGRVNFKTCFPGWYSGRTIHIHFRIKNNNNEQLVSQFCFDDALTEEICTDHPEYASRGAQDTPLSGGRDTVYGSNYQDYLFNTQQNSDGSLLIWKTIQVS